MKESSRRKREGGRNQGCKDTGAMGVEEGRSEKNGGGTFQRKNQSGLKIRLK